jgi:hypothetical protein
MPASNRKPNSNELPTKTPPLQCSPRAYNIIVKTKLAEGIETFVKENQKYGYRSIAGFIE